LPAGLTIAAIGKREDVRDALLSASGENLASLPKGSRIGTSSLRRQSQLLYARSDLRILELRGNVDTRIEKLKRGDYDAIVLAKAGLDRLGLSANISEVLPHDVSMPAAGQGAIGIEARTEGAETLRVTTSSGSANKVEQALETKFPQAQFKPIGQQQVGATVGKEIRQSAIMASLMALFGILVYVAFRYEFSFAVGAVVAVLHDVLLTIGCYCIANGISGREFNATVVAAVLTIIGFSINDKIVIFDRIREDLKLGVRGSFKEVINQALNQTLSRTIITSGTVFLATLSLYIFGGGVINDFAFTFLIGIVTGTYSSIYVASALVLWWHKGERPNIGASQVKLQNSASAKI